MPTISDYIKKEQAKLKDTFDWEGLFGENSRSLKAAQSFLTSSLTGLALLIKERSEGKYDSVFKWLLGEEGDFPNVLDKPHYAFRKELRERMALADLSEEITNEIKLV